VEMAGIEPASEKRQRKVSTRLVVKLQEPGFKAPSLPFTW